MLLPSSKHARNPMVNTIEPEASTCFRARRVCAGLQGCRLRFWASIRNVQLEQRPGIVFGHDCAIAGRVTSNTTITRMPRQLAIHSRHSQTTSSALGNLTKNTDPTLATRRLHPCPPNSMACTDSLAYYLHNLLLRSYDCGVFESTLTSSVGTPLSTTEQVVGRQLQLRGRVVQLVEVPEGESMGL